MTKHCPYCGRFIQYDKDLCERCNTNLILGFVKGILIGIHLFPSLLETYERQESKDNKRKR
jgi:hypothetical protein